jgi:hypothetical protein
MNDREQQRIIWEFQIPDSGELVETIPGFIKALHVRERDGEVCVWVILDSESKVLHKVRFKTVGTNWGLWSSDYEGEYIGTAYVGLYVWHVFMKVQS